MHSINLVTIKHMVKEKRFHRALYLTHDYDSIWFVCYFHEIWGVFLTIKNVYI